MDFLVCDHVHSAEWPKVDVKAPASLRRGAHQASAQEIGESRVLNRADDLTPIQAESREHFYQVKGPEIVDVLNRVVEQQGP